MPYTERDINEVISEDFLEYAGHVMQERSIPDARDGLKDGARKILYIQYLDKNTHDKNFIKGNAAVGQALKDGFLHGDASAYETLVRMGKRFACPYPLEEVQGNGGNQVSTDNHASGRYLEIRQSELASFLFRSIDKDVIEEEEWYWNYANTKKLPRVLPCIGFYPLVNGVTGISVGLSTSCPPTNLREVNEAIIKLIQNPSISDEQIYCAPDLPMGGTIINGTQVKQAMLEGHGKALKMRAKIEYIPDKNMLIATEIPFSVYTETIDNELTELINSEDNCGIARFIDATNDEGARINIYLRKNANVKKVINCLYQKTSLQSHFGINLILLEDGRFPKVFTWKEALQTYITHIRSCKTREYQFDLDKALARENIVEGLIKACASIDHIIELIRSSENVTEAAQKLQSEFNFNEAQSKAILALKLSSLTRLDAIKLEKELEELKKRIEELEYLLSNPTALDNELIKILREVANKFGDERRTQVIDLDEEAEEKKDQVQEEKDIAVVWDKKSIKVTSTKTRAKNAMFTTNYDSITVIGSGGKKYVFGLSELEPETEYRINELAPLASEKVLLLMPTSLFNSYSYVVTVSKQGFIKRSRIQEYVGRNKVAAKLDEGDELVGAFVSSNSADTILIVSDSNYYNYYEINEVGVTGRNTKGVKAIKLKTDEYVKYVVFFSCACTYDNVQVGSISIPYSSLIPTTRAIKGNKIGG